MPRKDLFGSQPPLELLRQWMDYDSWYDREKQQLKVIQDMQLCSSMGPPGGGRSEISKRLQSSFMCINFANPSDAQVKRIFSTLIAHKLQDFREDVKAQVEPITLASIGLYQAVESKFLPTPAKCHYLFNLRDVSKVFQGLYWAEPQLCEEKEALFRLWTHECFRVFMDRLIDDHDRQLFRQEVDTVMDTFLSARLKEMVAEGEELSFCKISFANPDAEDPPYDYINDKVQLKAFMTQKLEDYNDCVKGKALSIVMFNDAMQHAMKIMRIIRLARGNALLVGVGGSGRHCQSRMASFICDYTCFQVEIDKSYKHASFHEDLKKIYEKVGVKDQPLTFLFSDTEIVTESFLEDVSNALQSGEVPNLFASDEANAIRSSLEKPAKAAGIAYGPESLWGFFVERVRGNLHIVFCMSPIGENLRNYCRMYPSLVNSTTIDWFLPWPTAALAEVSVFFLAEAEVDEKVREPLSNTFGLAHTAVADMSARMQRSEKRHNYVTPTNFIELVQGYTATLFEKQAKIGGDADKLRNGLFKLLEARTQVEEMTGDLEIKMDIVAKRGKECQELLVVIVEKKMQADEKGRTVNADSVRLSKEAAEIEIVSADIELDLAKALPALEAANDALDKLDKKSIAEVKAYAKPPPAVTLTLSAVMTVLEKPITWASAKNELNDINFLARLKGFDKQNMSNSCLKKMEKYTKDPAFNGQLVLKVSMAAGALCQWVHAMKLYGEVWREVQPKEQKLAREKAKLAKKIADGESARQLLADIEKQVAELSADATEKEREKDELSSEAEELKTKLERAGQLVEGLAGEKDRWIIQVEKFDVQLGNLYGDCMVAAAFFSYAGPFGSSMRDELVSEAWMEPVKKFALPFSPDFTFQSFMAEPVDVRDWNLQGLPSDLFSIENGVLVTKTRRWPLMIDPQTQGNRWIRKKETPNDLKVLDPHTKDFMRTVERCIEWGHPVLMENVKEELDPSLEPVLAKNIVKTGGSYSIRIGDNELDYNMNFKFFLTTKMSNPHYTPEVSTKTTIVNFIVVQEGLTEQMLGVVVQQEEPILEEQNQELVVKISNGKNKLVELENEILRMLAESKGSLIDDLPLIATLQSSKETSISVTEQVENAEEKKEKIRKAREQYRPCGLRAAVLFFVLNDLVSIDPMYQFSLEAYVTLFTQSIYRYAEKNPMIAGDERIDLLNQYHQRAVYRYACRGLFERHKLLLSLHLASKVLAANKDFNKTEFNFFLRGGQVLDRSAMQKNPAPDWVTSAMWDNIQEVEKLENFRGFQTTFEQTLRDWRKWFMSPEPEREPLPGEWDARLDALQKLIVVRCIRTDRVIPAVAQFVSQRLAPEYCEPPAFDLDAVFEESNKTVPTLFVLSPGMDPTAGLMQCAAGKNLAPPQQVSLGQGQAPKAQKLLADGAQQGFWVFLANCHLSVKWLVDLEKLVAQLDEDSNDPEKGAHKDFRLWLSSNPTPQFPISLLQCAVKLTTEPPKGLKANMLRLLNTMSDEHFNRVKEHNKYKRLFFSLVWMHSILLERRKFRTLGWNTPYLFTDSDFDINENILAMYLDEYPTDIPWEAIRYLISEANYGGRVTEQPDNKLLKVYVNDFFTPAALQPKFQLSGMSTYYIPEDGNLQVYRHYVKELPQIELPEAFGQHGNAEIASALTDSADLLETCLGIQGGGGDGEAVGDSPDKIVLDACEGLQASVPDDLDWDDINERNASDQAPTKVCLLQEIERYNTLLVSLRMNIIELVRGIQGFVVISVEQMVVYGALLEGRVPEAWCKCYPSTKPLSFWLPDLIVRIEQLNQWGMYGAPKVFWLTGFTYPSSFLTALLQGAARKGGISVDQLNFDYLPQGHDENSVTSAPKEGAMIKGMFLEGARWDVNNSCLMEPEPMALYANMPIVHFRPVQKKKAAEGVYACPLYMYAVRTGTRERPSYITAVDLRAGARDGGFWTKRGAAMLLATA